MNHTHSHTIKERSFIISLILTGLVFLVELVGGFWTGSLALLSDSAHVFMDVFALGLSYLALRLALLPPNDRNTYGYHRMQILAAFANGATLLLISFEIFSQAWNRFNHPEEIKAGSMLIIAVFGLIINLVVALLLHRHDHDDINTRSAYLHVLGDALASIGVITAGIVIVFTGWLWVDPMISIFIGILILFSSGRVLQETIHILNEGMPGGLTVTTVESAMRTVPGITNIHDLHVWTIGPGYTALSAHVLLTDQALSQAQEIMNSLKSLLLKQFSINHTTIQFECQDCGQGGVFCFFNDHNHDH
jgi:cobalt-zinc-cadmium efflux system protein